MTGMPAGWAVGNKEKCAMGSFLVHTLPKVRGSLAVD